jgi:hypothetical protein
VSSYLLLPSVAALGAWFAFGASRRLFAVYSEYGSFLVLHPGNLGLILARVGLALARTGRGLPYLIPLLSLLGAGRPERRASIPLGTAAALVLFLVFAYLHLPEDPSAWIAWSAPRVFMPVAMLLALALGAAAGRAPRPSTEPPSSR